MRVWLSALPFLTADKGNIALNFNAWKIWDVPSLGSGPTQARALPRRETGLEEPPRTVLVLSWDSAHRETQFSQDFIVNLE